PWFAAVLAGGGLGGALAMQTVRTLPTWSSEIDLWRAGVAAHPQPYTWAAYGAVLEEAGLVAEAARYTERASSTTPPMPHACFNVTRRYLQSGAPAEAVRAGAAALAAGCPRSPELLAPLAVGQALGGDWAEAEATVSGMDGDPTGQAVLVRCAAAVRRGDLEVLLRTARSGRGEPDALRGQVAFLLRASGDEAAALVVEAMPFP
ncbi:MAG: hypothetical protein VX000_00550, partial [Myxococcota bacterium]|nr:hypothetical protein [Myxococcota bacterium]